MMLVATKSPAFTEIGPPVEFADTTVLYTVLTITARFCATPFTTNVIVIASEVPDVFVWNVPKEITSKVNATGMIWATAFKLTLVPPPSPK